jgi:hypothetical protein
LVNTGSGTILKTMGVVAGAGVGLTNTATDITVSTLTAKVSTTTGSGLSLNGGGETALGLGGTCKFTSDSSGSPVYLRVYGWTNGGGGGTGTLKLRYGTGTAPANGATSGLGTSLTTPAWVSGGVTQSVEWITASLTASTNYWFDVTLTRASGTVSITGAIGVICVAVF